MNDQERFSRRLRTFITAEVGLVIAYLVVFGILNRGADSTAVSNAVIVFLTAALVGVTTLYMLITHDLAVEAARSNDMAAKATERTLRAAAPILEVRVGSRDFDEQGGVWTFHYSVRNHGRSVAHRVRLHTKYGEAISDKPVQTEQDVPREYQTLTLRLNTSDHPDSDHPTVNYCSFVDAGGTWWRQVPGGLPTVVEGPPPDWELDENE